MTKTSCNAQTITVKIAAETKSNLSLMTTTGRWRSLLSVNVTSPETIHTGSKL